jgi:S-adenosylmethionine hydrolase
MRPISFLSDFGLADEFVGVVHGVLATVAPTSTVIDVTHGIERGDVRGGALALMRAMPYLPEGVALAVIDPGVGTDRRAIAAETEWGHFVGPDNGLLSPAVASVGGASRVVTLENPDARIPSPGRTFDGRDVFGPAAALLASGDMDFADLGTPVDPESLTPMLLPLAEHQADGLMAAAWWTDRFGNVQTNASPDDLMMMGLREGDTISVKVGSRTRALRWVGTYGDAAPGQLVVHVDSYGMIALAVVEGSAAEELEITGERPLRFSPPSA